MASSRHGGSWQNTSRVGKHEAQPSCRNAIGVFSQLPKCLDEAILHGNKLYTTMDL